MDLAKCLIQNQWVLMNFWCSWWLWQNVWYKISVAFGESFDKVDDFDKMFNTKSVGFDESIDVVDYSGEYFGAIDSFNESFDESVVRLDDGLINVWFDELFDAIDRSWWIFWYNWLHGPDWIDGEVA